MHLECSLKAMTHLSLFPRCPSAGRYKMIDRECIYNHGTITNKLKVPSKNSLPPYFVDGFLRAQFHVSRIIGSTVEKNDKVIVI